MSSKRPSITFHEAYRFEIRSSRGTLHGTVTKVLRRRKTWQAWIDGTTTRAVAETRQEAVLTAYAEATADPDR